MVRADDGGQARGMTTATPPLAQPTELPPTAETPQTPQTPQAPLRRSATDRMIAGVCGGLAEYFNVDPVIIRIVGVILLLPGGFPGLIPYVILWIIVPEEGETSAGGPDVKP